MEERPDKLRPALLGGLFIGVVSAIPVINIINCFCCAGVIGGGILAVQLYNKSLGPLELQYSEGVIIGLMTGASGALISTIIESVIGQNIGEAVNRLLEAYPDIPPELENILLQVQDTQGDLFFIILGLVFALIIYSVFAILGGIIGVSLFKKNKTNYTPPQIEE